ncbi:uncharacterized protein PRCAT00002255001 [Priceomyces carsonii]|uniref:uncharacterized protein n=1 Tax=Priceomyces carsonii TaxID=28549 RepID=UPI002EDA69F3|nr:unnamed protein product [Priceomyces carsonii]
MQELPDSVTSLLKSTRFVHLATCQNNIPHVTLMNYTYYNKPSEGQSYIIITTPRDTIKYENILANPNVSLLVHDWISAKASDNNGETENKRRNSLYELLTNLNRTEISRVSVMLTGKAKIIEDTDSDEYKFYKSLHLNNTLIDDNQAKNYISNDNNVLVLVKIERCKVTDTDDNVQEF